MRREYFLKCFVAAGVMLVLVTTSALCFDRDTLSRSAVSDGENNPSALSWEAPGPPDAESTTEYMSGEMFPAFPHLLGQDPPDRWKWKVAPKWYYYPTTNAIALNPNNPSVLYAATDNGLYKSTDGGTNWVISKQYASSCVAIHPMFPRVVFLGQGIERQQGGIFRSTDNGSSWSKVLHAAYGTDAVAIDPQRPNIIYAGIQEWTGVEDYPEGRFMKSTNGGQSWEILGQTVWNWQIYAIAVNPENPDIVFLGSNFNARGLQKSQDGGVTWTLPLPGIDVHSFAIDPVNPHITYIGTFNHGVFKSIDWGDTWKSTNCGLPDSSTLGASYVVIDPRDTDLLYVGTRIGIFESEDGGTNWTDKSGNLQDKSIRSLAVDLSSSPGSMFIGTVGGTTSYGNRNGGIFKNDELDWTLASSGILQKYYDAAIHALAVHPQYSRIIYAGGYVGIIGNYYHPENPMLFISIDSGMSWTPLRDGWVDAESIVVGRLRDILIHPVDHNIVYAGANDGLRISQNYGLTFEHANLTGVTMSLAIDPVDTDILYAGVYNNPQDIGGIYKSTNGGWDWFPVNNGIPEPENKSFKSILVDPTDPNIVYARCYDYVYKTINGGESWDLMASDMGHDAEAFCMDPVNTSILYAGDYKDVWKTTDGGEIWNIIYTFDPVGGDGMKSLLIDPVDPSTLYLSKSVVGFFKSKDSGKTWTEMNDWSLGVTGVMAMCPSARNRLYSALPGKYFQSFTRSINLELDPETTEVVPGQVLGIDAALTNFLNHSVSVSAVIDVYLDSEPIYHSSPIAITLKPYQTLSHRFEMIIPEDVIPGSVLRVFIQVGEEPDYDNDWDAFDVTVVSP